MLMIRMQRIGRRKDPHFRLIVTDKSRGPKSGKYVEMIGSYNPKSGEVRVNEERAKYWMSVGAHLSNTVHNFFVDKKLIESGKKRSGPLFKEKTKEEEKVETKKEEDIKEVADSGGEESTEVTTDVDGDKAEDAPKEENTDETETPTEIAKEGANTADDDTNKEEDSPEEKKALDEQTQSESEAGGSENEKTEEK